MLTPHQVIDTYFLEARHMLLEIAALLEKEGLNFGMRYEESTEGVRILDMGTPPSRAAENAPDDEDDEE